MLSEYTCDDDAKGLTPNRLPSVTEVLQTKRGRIAIVGIPFAPTTSEASHVHGDPDPDVRAQVSKGVNSITAMAMTAFHIGAVAAFFFIDAGAILTAFILYFVAGMLGIGMAYHRLLTHRGYKTYKWVEYFLTWCGTLALEGGPIFWVATHRVHHQKSDREGDPHTPREGTWWAHMGWILTGQGLHHDAAVLSQYVPDLQPRSASTCGCRTGTGRRTSSSACALLAFGGMGLRAVGHLLPHHRSACTARGW